MTTHSASVPDVRIVVGVDGSPPSEMALRWAATISKATRARIEVITTWQIPVTYGWALMGEGWKPDKDANELLTKTVDDVFGTDKPDEMRLLVEEGNPAKVLLERSVGAQMLVVGSRGRGGFAGLLLGSVSAACVEHASCPVLVVH